MQKRLVSKFCHPRGMGSMGTGTAGPCWALFPLRTSLKEGDMISFRVEIGSGKAEAVNVELI